LEGNSNDVAAGDGGLVLPWVAQRAMTVGSRAVRHIARRLARRLGWE
jgi:hypothetical protein